MEAIVFQTQNENYYLYSPLKKAILPLSKNVYDIISNDRNEGDETFRQLKQYGYLDKYTSSFDSYITGNTIQGVLVKLSQIIFETTTLCNLRCEYCCYSEGYDTFDSRRGMLGNLKFETAKSIIDYLAILFQKEPLSNAPKEPFAISFYGGEPLMNFAVVRQIVEYAERIEFRNRSLFFTMTTNAMLLSKYADFLSRHKFKMLISLDGNKENDSYRITPNGNPSFDIVMKNLKCVENLYSEWFATFRYNAVFTNKSDVREIVDWFKMQFNTTPNFSPLHVPTEDAKDGNRILSMLKTFEIPEDIELVPSLITQNPLFNRILVFTTRLLNNSVSKESELLVDESIENSTLPTGTCIPFSKRLFVSYNGKIHPCEKVNRDSPLGYIDNSGCVHIDCNEVANGFMKRIAEVSSLCKKCYMQFCCTKCSFCYSNGKCEEFTSLIKFAKLLSLDELGFFYDGAGIDICDINKNGTPDLLMMVYDAPEGENSFRYQIAFDLQSNGNYLSLSPVYEVPGLGHDGDGAGVAVGDIDNNGTLDILFMALDAPSGKDKFVYEILPDIDKYGNSYAKPIYTPRFPDSLSPCDTGQGAACCLYDLDNNGFLDAIFVAIENIKGKSNSWKYVTGHNLNKQGVPMCWR